MGALVSKQRSESISAVFIDSLFTAYPKPTVDERFLDNVISRTGLDDTEQIAKLHAVNKRTGIKSRPVILDQSDAFYDREPPYQVEKLTAIWLEHGIDLSEQACLGAIADWGGSIGNITHLVAATCSIQSHPGIDAHIAQRLKLHPDVGRTLLSGVGCAGGVALLRTAYEFATAATFRNKPARILVVACDLNSLGFRSELEKLKQGHFPVGLTLFSDAAAAAVISNGIGDDNATRNAHHQFEIRHWMHHTIPDSLHELQLMPTSIGPVSTISKRLPELIPEAVKDLFFKLVSSAPKLVGSNGQIYHHPRDFDWDIHPGGLGIFEQIMKVMDLTEEHTSATATTYMNWGNSAGPTVLKVLDVQRKLPMNREYVVCCGFGNNIDITMLILKRFR